MRSSRRSAVAEGDLSTDGRRRIEQSRTDVTAPLPQTEREDGTCEVAVAYRDLVVDRAGIVSVLGYRDGAMPEHFGEMLDQALDRAESLCRPQAGYRLVPAGRTPGRFDALTVGDHVFAVQKIVAGALAKAEQVAVFACSLGAAFEDWARSMMVDDPALGFIADAVGSAVAESLADRLHDHIETTMAGHGWKITNRYSPGYCGWSVADQHGLFSLLPGAFCGITLGESALMHPVKSVSGVIGVGAAVKHGDYLCDVCNQRDCTYRRYHERRAALGMEDAR